MATRALRGDTVYSIARWLEREQAPVPRFRPPGGKWGFSMVDGLLRNPLLAGLTAHNPGRPRGGVRGPEVLRGDDGQPIVDSALAIITVEQHHELVHRLSNKGHPAAIAVAQRERSSPMLSMLATCADCKVLMWRFRLGNRYALRCRSCNQVLGYRPAMDYLERRLLSERGKHAMYRRTMVVPNNPSASMKLASIDLALRTAALELTRDGADITVLNVEIARLKRARSKAANSPSGPPEEVLVPVGRTLADVWQACSTDEQRRSLLSDHCSG
jgi:hypothetical protein